MMNDVQLLEEIWTRNDQQGNGIEDGEQEQIATAGQSAQFALGEGENRKSITDDAYNRPGIEQMGLGKQTIDR